MDRERLLSLASLNTLFRQIDEHLTREQRTMDLISIGGAVLIAEGMLDRQTEDIDLFGNDEADKPWLARAVRDAGLDFDPDNYRDQDKPYVQWVDRDFVHMPESDAWMKDKAVAWEGQSLKIFRPPWGVLLGNKLASNRDKDFADIEFMVQHVKNWEHELDAYLHLFSSEDRELILDNKVLALAIANSQPRTVRSSKPGRQPK